MTTLTRWATMAGIDTVLGRCFLGAAFLWERFWRCER